MPMISFRLCKSCCCVLCWTCFCKLSNDSSENYCSTERVWRSLEMVKNFL